MPTFRSVLPFLRDVGSRAGSTVASIRQRPLPKAALGVAKHELMFDLVMRNDDETRLPPTASPRRYSRTAMA